MADIIAMSITTQTLTGQGNRMQILAGTVPNQWLVADFELSSANVATLMTAMNPVAQTLGTAATVGQTSTINQAAGPAAILGYTNAI